jgi:hypothetical protein
MDERDVLEELGKAKAAGLPNVQEFTWLFKPAETRQ